MNRRSSRRSGAPVVGFLSLPILVVAGAPCPSYRVPALPGDVIPYHTRRDDTATQVPHSMTSLPRADSVQPQLPQGHFDRANGVVGTRQGDTTVLLDVNRGMYYTLNEVGGRIWELLGEGVAVPAIVERLQEEYDVAAETLVTDATGLIDRLLRVKLIRPAGR